MRLDSPETRNSPLFAVRVLTIQTLIFFKAHALHQASQLALKTGMKNRKDFLSDMCNKGYKENGGYQLLSHELKDSLRPKKGPNRKGVCL